MNRRLVGPIGGRRWVLVGIVLLVALLPRCFTPNYAASLPGGLSEAIYAIYDQCSGGGGVQWQPGGIIMGDTQPPVNPAMFGLDLNGSGMAGGGSADLAGKIGADGRGIALQLKASFGIAGVLPTPLPIVDLFGQCDLMVVAGLYQVWSESKSFTVVQGASSSVAPAGEGAAQAIASDPTGSIVCNRGGMGTIEQAMVFPDSPVMFMIFPDDQCFLQLSMVEEVATPGTHHFVAGISARMIGYSCQDDGDCMDPLPFCGPGGSCQSGTNYNECLDDDDCDAEHECSGSGTCERRSGVGELCADDEDCEAGLVCTLVQTHPDPIELCAAPIV